MQKNELPETIDSIVARDPRFEKDAYLFLRDALDFTIKNLKRARAAESERHVSGGELLDGVRQYALQQFGPMVPTVFLHWRVSSGEDIGAMVFNLIDAGVFGKTDRDSIDDFKNGFDFHDAFVTPFRPTGATEVTRDQSPSMPAGTGRVARSPA